MENNNPQQKPDMKKIMINMGLLLGVISILISVVNYTLGDNIFQPHWSLQLLGFIISIVVIVYGMKQYKESNQGFLKLGEAIKIGLGISVISGILGVVYFIIFTNFIEPTFFEQYIDFQREAAIEGNPDLSVEQIDAGLKMSKPFMNAGFFAAIQIILALFFGFIISLISGLVLKRENPAA